LFIRVAATYKFHINESYALNGSYENNKMGSFSLIIVQHVYSLWSTFDRKTLLIVASTQNKSLLFLSLIQITSEGEISC